MDTIGFKSEEKLSGSVNFNSWKARLTTILDENDQDVGRLAYKRKQAKARRVIYDSIREELMPNITTLKTAKECYDTLVPL